MKKIYFCLILLCSINFYGNDTITVISLKNRNLREHPTSKSKILAEIKNNDTLKLTAKGKNWLEVIYKDSLKGYIINESLEVVKNKKAEILKLKIIKQFFFKAFLLISILCLGLLYLLKKKLIQFEINGKISLVAKALLLGFILTVIGILYFFYEQLSFLKIFGIIVLLILLIYKTYNIFILEKLIKLNKDLFIDEENGENITIVNHNYINKIIENEKVNFDKIKNNLEEVKSNIRAILETEYSSNDVRNLLFGIEPIIGMPKKLLYIYFGKPDKIITENNPNIIKETFRYGFIRIYYH